MKKLFILAPFRHESNSVQELNRTAVKKFQADCLARGIFALATHAVVDMDLLQGNEEERVESFKKADRFLASEANGIILLKISRWEESKGIAKHLERAKARGLNIFPVEFCSNKESFGEEVFEEIKKFFELNRM